MQTSLEESALIKAFVVPSKQRRYLEILSKPKNRKKLIDNLYHFQDLNPEFMVAIEAQDLEVERIHQRLCERGAGTHCHAISTDSEIDGTRLPLMEALTRVVFRGGGTLLSCVPGRLGYFEGEHEKDRYILARPARR